jgi:hypothetical protein
MTHPSLSPVFVDHSDLATLTNALALNSTQLPPASADQQFWATPDRPNTDATIEVVEIDLSGARLVNTLSFDLARYPHSVSVEYADASGAWRPAIDASSGTPVSVSISESVPARLPKATVIPGHLHPQHAYANHWEPISLRLRPVNMLRLRLQLQRSTQSAPPTDTFGMPVAYSLAVANLRIGYEVAGLNDVPRSVLETGSFNTQESFATTSDLLGSSVDYALRTKGAANILNNTGAPSLLIWQSEPQPFPGAVVPFYADIRDAGQAQILDKIFIDPVQSGAHITIYYSNDVPIGGFDGSATALTAEQAQMLGTATLQSDRLRLGSGSGSASVKIDNQAIGFDPSLPWWVGMVIRPNFTPSSGMAPRTLFDCGTAQVQLVGSGVALSMTGNNALVLPLDYGALQSISLIASFDGSRLRLHARTSIQDKSLDAVVSVAPPTAPIASFMLGASLDTTHGASIDVLDFVLKEEALASDIFLDEPDAYSSVSDFPGEDAAIARNALIRFDPFNTLSLSGMSPSGLYGGVANKYASMFWTPIPRDYIAQRGWMKLPPTQAKFIKLEFTNLQAVYNEVYIPVNQTVLTFPPTVMRDFAESQALTERAQQTHELGNVIQASLAGKLPFTDFPTITGTGGTGKGYTNTEAYVVDDYNSAQNFYAARGVNWGYENWHPGISAPRWSSTSEHVYTTQIVTRTTTVAYQVGLRQISFARTLYTGNDTVGCYDDALFDELNISSSSWIFETDQQALSSGQAQQAQATSVTFGASRDVRGVQFAAQQSPPVQILPDSGFDDPQRRYWQLVGDAQVVPDVSKIPVIGSVLELTRSVVLGYWGDIAPVYLTYGGMALAALTWGQLAQGAHTSETLGGIASLPQKQPVGGRLYAAARVFAEQDLVSPLWVQIVDTVTGAVLSEESAVVKRDQVTEWYTSYTLGEGGARVGNLWGDLTGSTSPVLPRLSDSFARADASTLGTMDTNQIWQATAGGGLHIASAKAAVTVAGQISFIDTQTPWGTLVVGLGNYVAGTYPTTSVPMIDLGTFIVMDDGRIMSINDTEIFYNLTLASNDTLTFDFMPTKSLSGPETPSGSDPVITPWAIAISRNGTYLTTLLSGSGYSSIRSLQGAVGQSYTSFNWTPRATQIPTSNTVSYHLPMPTDGSLTVPFTSTTPNIWTDSHGFQWTYSYGWQFNTASAVYANANYASAALATPGQELSLYLNTLDTFGTLRFTVLTNAAGVPLTNQSVAIIDGAGSTIYLRLRADGALTDPVGNVVAASGLNMGLPITVRYLNPQWCSSAFKTTYGVASNHNQAIVFCQDGVVTGVFTGYNILRGTTRGLLGYAYDSTHYTIIEGMAWSPEASQVLTQSGAGVTWGQVDQGDTITWGGLLGHTLANINPIEARVVQKRASSDTWLMDNLSLFSDPIEWEFSNNGGEIWCSAYEIRNNPNGVLVFPPTPVDAQGQAPAGLLRWRVTAFGPNCWVSHIVIRPWYVGFMRGAPVRSTASAHGPNLNSYDHYPPIESDPRFQVWSNPIPRDWFFAFRSINGQVTNSDATQWVTLLVGDAFIIPS